MEAIVRMTFTGGLPETKCGAGSTLANTSNIRAWLPGLFKQLRVVDLLDIPCGDFNWMSRTDLSSVNYIGCDCDPQHCESTRSRSSMPSSFNPRKKTVVELDMIDDPLPRADLMLCRDFFQHLPNVDIADAIENFIDSYIPWMLCTSHDNVDNDDIELAGMFRPLNLTSCPFSFPAPQKWVEDGSGRILGLWNRLDILDAA